MRKLFEIKCNVVAFIISLFSFMAVSRKYDDWYYLRGRKISKYDWTETNSRWMRMLFGTDSISDIRELDSITTAEFDKHFDELKERAKNDGLRESDKDYKFVYVGKGVHEAIQEQLSTSHPFF